MLGLGLVRHLGAMVARSLAVTLASAMVLFSRCLMVYRVHQSRFGVVLMVSTSVKHTIRLIRDKEVATMVVRTVRTVTSKGFRRICWVNC